MLKFLYIICSKASKIYIIKSLQHKRPSKDAKNQDCFQLQSAAVIRQETIVMKVRESFVFLSSRLVVVVD